MSDSIGLVSVDVTANLSPIAAKMQEALSLADGMGDKVGNVFGRRFGYSAARGMGSITDFLQGGVQLGGATAFATGLGASFIKLGRTASEAAADFNRYKLALIDVEKANGRVANATQVSERSLKKLQDIAIRSKYDPNEIFQIASRQASRMGSVEKGTASAAVLVDAIEALGVKKQDLDRFVANVPDLFQREGPVSIKDFRQLVKIAPMLNSQAARALGMNGTVGVEEKISKFSGKQFEELLMKIGELNKGLAETRVGQDPKENAKNVAEAFKTALIPTGLLLNQNVLNPALSGASFIGRILGDFNNATGGGAGLSVTIGLFVLAAKQANAAITSLVLSVNNLTMAAQRLSGATGVAGFNPKNANPSNIKEALQYNQELKQFNQVRGDALKKLTEDKLAKDKEFTAQREGMKNIKAFMGSEVESRQRSYQNVIKEYDAARTSAIDNYIKQRTENFYKLPANVQLGTQKAYQEHTANRVAQLEANKLAKIEEIKLRQAKESEIVKRNYVSRLREEGVILTSLKRDSTAIAEQIKLVESGKLDPHSILGASTVTNATTKAKLSTTIKEFMKSDGMKDFATFMLPQLVGMGLTSGAKAIKDRKPTGSSLLEAIGTGISIGGAAGMFFGVPGAAIGAGIGAIGGATTEIMRNEKLKQNLGREMIGSPANSFIFPLFIKQVIDAANKTDADIKLADLDAKNKFSEAVKKFEDSVGKIVGILGNGGVRTDAALSDLTGRYIYSVAQRANGGFI